MNSPGYYLSPAESLTRFSSNSFNTGVWLNNILIEDQGLTKKVGKISSL